MKNLCIHVKIIRKHLKRNKRLLFSGNIWSKTTVNKKIFIHFHKNINIFSKFIQVTYKSPRKDIKIYHKIPEINFSLLNNDIVNDLRHAPRPTIPAGYGYVLDANEKYLTYIINWNENSLSMWMFNQEKHSNFLKIPVKYIKIYK